MTKPALSSLVLCVVLATPVIAQVSDHLKCYNVRDPLKLAGTADLDTPQFGADTACKISKAKLFCVSATKTNVAVTDKATGNLITPLPISGPDPGDRICYKVKCEQLVADQEVTDQFGTRTLTKFKTSLVCTPAVKGTAFCGDGTRNGSEECDGTDLGPSCGGCQADCSCRFRDNGNGTVSDRQTGLQWEKKDNTCPGPHCVNDTFSWSSSGTAPDGTAFTTFLANLNGGATGVGNCVAPSHGPETGGFGNHCDWRLPTIQELLTLVDLSAPGCSLGIGIPCIDPIFLPTGIGSATSSYWSSTTNDSTPLGAWFVVFNNNGFVGGAGKLAVAAVRAVRRGL